jgi:hypothetical protein
MPEQALSLRAATAPIYWNRLLIEPLVVIRVSSKSNAMSAHKRCGRRLALIYKNLNFNSIQYKLNIRANLKLYFYVNIFEP